MEKKSSSHSKFKIIIFFRKPVMRERWELSNDDVILMDKIGRVSFQYFQQQKKNKQKINFSPLNFLIG